MTISVIEPRINKLSIIIIYNCAFAAELSLILEIHYSLNCFYEPFLTILKQVFMNGVQQSVFVILLSTLYFLVYYATTPSIVVCLRRH